MEHSLLTACDFILSSNKKLTSMKIMYPKDNEIPINEVITNFTNKFPQYNDTIIIKYIEYEIKEEEKRKKNSEYIGYFIVMDKKYIKDKEKRIFPSITKKCNGLKRNNILVDLLDVRVHNLEELEFIVDEYYNEYPCKEDFSISAEKDKTQYFISMMNIEKYQQELENK